MTADWKTHSKLPLLGKASITGTSDGFWASRCKWFHQMFSWEQLRAITSVLSTSQLWHLLYCTKTLLRMFGCRWYCFTTSNSIWKFICWQKVLWNKMHHQLSLTAADTKQKRFLAVQDNLHKHLSLMVWCYIWELFIWSVLKCSIVWGQFFYRYSHLRKLKFSVSTIRSNVEGRSLMILISGILIAFLFSF